MLGVAGVAVLTKKLALASPLLGRSVFERTNPDLTLAKKQQGKFHADGLDTSPVEGVKYTMVIDAGACIGCRTCQYACKAENNIPDTISPHGLRRLN